MVALIVSAFWDFYIFLAQPKLWLVKGWNNEHFPLLMLRLFKKKNECIWNNEKQSWNIRQSLLF